MMRALGSLWRGSSRAMSFTYPVPRDLKDIAKVPLLMQRDPQTIAALWKKQFENRKDVVTSVMSSQEYDRVRNNAKRSPMFVLPVEVEGRGNYNCILQFIDAKSALFTSVDSCKVNGIRSAPPYFILTAFDELVAKRGIVLVRGDIVNPRDVSKENAQMLMSATLKFYTDINLYIWVERFNHRSREFEFEEFKRQCRSILTPPGGSLK